jgi:hypothetical protein
MVSASLTRVHACNEVQTPFADHEERMAPQIWGVAPIASVPHRLQDSDVHDIWLSLDEEKP